LGWMLEKYKCLNPQPKNISELKSALLKIWDELPQDAVKSITSFHKRRSGRLVAENQHAGCPPSDFAPGAVVRPPDPLFHFCHCLSLFVLENVKLSSYSSLARPAL